MAKHVGVRAAASSTAGRAEEADGPLAPRYLRCEYLVNPLGIESKAPRLSWEVNDPRRGAVQGAYRVLVAATPEDLAADKGGLWDSGRVASDQSAHVVYAGEALASGRPCFWKVRTWDAAGTASPWSEPATWSMGLLDANDWKARWIGYVPERDPGTPSLEGGKWIWFPEEGVNVLWGAPAATRYFRRTVSIPPGAKIKSARFAVTADDQFVLFVNGREVGSSDGLGDAWRRQQCPDVAAALVPGENVLAVAATNTVGGPAGLTGRLVVRFEKGDPLDVLIDGSWKTATKEEAGWQTAGFDDAAWVPPVVIGDVGMQPWGIPSAGPGIPPSAILRKAFKAGRKVRRAAACASAMGLYELRLNGRKVGDDLLTPGWTEYAKRVYYNTYDVTDLLRQGENVVGAYLAPGWYGLRGRYGADFRFLAQLLIEYDDGSTEVVATDDTWRAAAGPILLADLYDGETCDARNETPGWDAPGFDDAGWDPVALGTSKTAARLQAYPGVTVRRTGELKALAVTEPRPGAYVFDLGQNFTGWARLRIRADAGTRIVLRFAEVLNPDGTVYTINLRSATCTDTYVCKGGGVETWEPRFTFHGFRYVEVTGCKGKPPLDTITGIPVNSDTPVAGWFECSNPLLNRFWLNTTWTQRGNFVDVPTDCPQRDERLGWTGDAQVFVRAATCNMDVAAFFTKWLVDLEDVQHPDGAFTDVAPLGGGAGTAAWGDAGTICPWTMYQVYGDRRLLEKHYPAMTRWIAYLENHSDGLLRPDAGYGDWLSINADTPKDLIGTAYFALSTRIVADAAEVLGRQADAARYQDLWRRIKAAFIKAYVGDDGHVKGDTQTACLLALRFDLLPDDRRQAVTRRLVDDIRRRGHLSTGFVGAGHLLPVLTRTGHLDVAYLLLENTTFPSWLYPVAHGATSIWERWDGWTEERGFQDPGMNSFAHYAYGCAAEWLFSDVAGIDTDGPGFRRILIRPRPGGRLTGAKASYRSIHGEVASGWRRKDGALELDVTVPANTTATVHVPAKDAAAVTEGGRPAGQAEGVRFLRMDSGAAVYEIGAGTYRFASKID